MMEEIKTKVCTKCKKELPSDTDFYHRDSKTKSGLTEVCKNCRKKQKHDNHSALKLTDGYVARCMGFNVNDVDKEFIETKRLTIKIKRVLKLKSFKKKTNGKRIKF